LKIASNSSFGSLHERLEDDPPNIDAQLILDLVDRNALQQLRPIAQKAEVL
jgi:hypothetical protein